MNALLPTSKATNHTGVRRRFAQTAARLQTLDNNSPHRMSRAKGGPMVVSLDGAHVRAVPGFQVRHFEVTVGRVETDQRPARHFAIAPNVRATKRGTIGNALRAQGWLPGRDVVVLSDGDPALVESVRSAAGDGVTHILDWFHISMRVRHVEQALAGLLGSELEHKGPLRSVEDDVVPLRHLIWNGYGKQACRALLLCSQQHSRLVHHGNAIATTLHKTQNVASDPVPDVESYVPGRRRNETIASRWMRNGPMRGSCTGRRDIYLHKHLICPLRAAWSFKREGRTTDGCVYSQ